MYKNLISYNIKQHENDSYQLGSQKIFFKLLVKRSKESSGWKIRSGILCMVVMGWSFYPLLI